MKSLPVLSFGVIAVALAGCRSSTGTPVVSTYPIIEVSSKWVEFGLTEHGEAVTRTFTISNNGDLPMGISDIREGGGMDGDFTVTYDPTLKSCPESAETDTGEPTAKSGGAAPPGPVISSDVTTVDFGKVAAGSDSLEYLTLTNTGDADLSITKAAIAPSDSPFSMVVDPTGSTIPKGGSTVVLLNYAPTTNTGDEALLVIVSNGTPAVLEVDLKGNIGGEPIDTDTGIGGDSSSGDSGGGDSGGGDTGTDPGDGQVLFTLEKGCKMPVDVTFSPVSVGDVYGSVIIETKTQDREDEEDPEYWADLDNARTVVYTKGEAEKGEGRAIVTPRSVPFGSVWTGEEEVRYIRVLNSGDGDLTLTAPTLDSTCDAAFSLTYSFAETADSTKVLESGKSSLIEVTFVPEDQKSAYCTVYVNSDDSSNPSVPVYLQGNNGTDPDNVPPTVSIRSPEPGYMHNNPGPIEMELNVFDKNQPATSLSCKVYSSLNVLANVADCTPTESSGHVFLSVPTEDFNPGVDTLLVRVTDASGIRTTASLSMIINAAYPSSDDDGDAFGTDSSELVVDCDDNNRDTYPNAAEIYDSLDNDCDSIVDEGTIGSDDDGDTFSENDLDCDDTDEDTYPGAPESPDYKDNDCDGTIDENTTLSDDDGDGYAEVNNDCNDLDEEISPSAVEICDSVDNDCNGLVDDACLALDSEPLIIGGIDMSQTAVEEGDTVQLSTFIYDADGETIFFTWTTDGGTSAGTTSSTLSWTAPEKLENDEGEIFQIYLVAQDASGHQVWDFARVAVYPDGALFKDFVEIVYTEEESGCSSSGAGAGVGLGLLGLGLAMARRRRQS